jgi:hypothetical protein
MASQAAEKVRFERFVTGHDFRVCVRTNFSFGQWSKKLEKESAVGAK